MHADLAEKLGYTFKSNELLSRSLTHKSFDNEFPKKSKGHNERLEFLGDAVLDLALSDYLMKRFPELNEGELSKIRASLVNEKVLAEVALELGLENLIRFGKGEFKSGGSLKPRLLSCAFEALVGALYRDSDFQNTNDIILKIFFDRIENLDLETHFKSDYKTHLQEKLQGMLKQIPNYELEREEGPDHNKVFFVKIKIDDQVVATGTGRSKKQAEQDAARIALENLL
ncbi:MAG: ribonuclease III [Bdellovibrionales bacterium]|nr:ribonuclease III [Bdellovibrionales bacterium]